MHIPDLAFPHSPPDAASPTIPRLAALQGRIAALRVQAQAAQAASPATTGAGELPMAAVFTMPTVPPEGLSADRDATKRDERLVALLRERGTLRVLGAVASPTLAETIGELYISHPNFSAAVDYVLGEEILARQRGGALCGLRLLVHGKAGVGKTDFALSLSKLLAVPAEVLSLSSAQAAATLAGSEQYWGNTQPGLVWKALIQGSHANPLFVLDEIDKVTDRWGDPLGALYQLLESRSAAIFCDKSVPWLPVDASRVHWIATANNLDALHPAIRSRFLEVEVDPPSAECLQGIVQRLYADLLAEFGLAGRFPKALPVAHLQALSGLSIRDTKRLLRTALARALREGRTQLALATVATPATQTQRIGFI